MTFTGVSAPFWKALPGKLQLFGAWLAGFGLFGLFLLAYADAIIPLTPIPDATLALICAHKVVWWWWAAAVAACGSSLGCWTVYWLVRRLRQRFLGRTLLARQLSPERRARIEALIQRYDVAVLAAAAVMPPPFPFKPFVICAGLLEFHQGRLLAGLFIGRVIRYGVLAYLSKRYGGEALNLIQQNTSWFFLGVGVVVVILSVHFFTRWFIRRRILHHPSDARSAEAAGVPPDIRAQDA
ncbi:MAG: VTT domain-containing protein [Chloracidobacterium sp.]|nr:VTT domain-containing protein [Chloracidobacterium sp.]MDW8218485.1 VTT domain-containing protein [Acidobacteriota bacterium]